MAYHSLGEFLEALERSGQLVPVSAPVDPALEISEITDRVAEGKGPAILFGDVRGRELPVVSNLFGTEQRICKALGVSNLDDVARRLSELVDASEPDGWFEQLQAGSTRGVLRQLGPKVVKTGQCQQVIRLGGDVDLRELPALKSHAEEQGPVITAGQLLATDAESGHRWLDAWK